MPHLINDQAAPLVGANFPQVQGTKSNQSQAVKDMDGFYPPRVRLHDVGRISVAVRLTMEISLPWRLVDPLKIRSPRAPSGSCEPP
jgi:hypothetical protein